MKDDFASLKADARDGQVRVNIGHRGVGFRTRQLSQRSAI
jgi:hypothetical protein